MAKMPFPINEKPFYNTDEIANSIASVQMMDCILEAVPEVGFVTRRRPGLKSFGTLGPTTTSVGDGLFYWDAMKWVIGVIGGKVFRVMEDGTTTEIPGDPLSTGTPVTFAEGQDIAGTSWLYMANGKLVYTKGSEVLTPIYSGQLFIDLNQNGYAALVHDISWILTSSTGPVSANAYTIIITNDTVNDYSAITASIVGTDLYDAPQTEVVTLPVANARRTSTEMFKTITSITTSATIGDGLASENGFLDNATEATWTLTATAPTDTFCRKVTIKNLTANSHSTKTAVITGTSSTDAVLEETINLPGASLTVTSTNYFKTVTTIVPSATIGSDTMDIGWDAYGGLSVGWGTDASELTSSNVPDATHVDFLASAFIANEKDTNRFYFTDTNPLTGLYDNLFWGSTDSPLTCEAKGDKLSALFVAWQELNCWGTEGLEIWQNDATTPFSPITSAFSEGGLEAPYSIVVTDNTVFALCVIAGSRVIVRMSGRTPIVISNSIATILANMVTVSDAIGNLISVGGLALYLLTFPFENQSWVYDYKNDAWYRWSHYVNGEHERFLGQHTCFAKVWNKHLILSSIDNTIYELQRETFTDNGETIAAFRRSGWVNHGTFNRKICDQFYIKCKAGLSDTAKLLFRWRDDGDEEWSEFAELELGPVGQRDFLARETQMGSYHSRQYEFRFTEDSDLVLCSVEAEVRGVSS